MILRLLISHCKTIKSPRKTPGAFYCLYELVINTKKPPSRIDLEAFLCPLKPVCIVKAKIKVSKETGTQKNSNWTALWIDRKATKSEENKEGDKSNYHIIRGFVLCTTIITQ